MRAGSRPISSGHDVVAQVGGDGELAAVEGGVADPGRHRRRWSIFRVTKLRPGAGDDDVASVIVAMGDSPARADPGLFPVAFRAARKRGTWNVERPEFVGYHTSTAAEGVKGSEGGLHWYRRKDSTRRGPGGATPGNWFTTLRSRIIGLKLAPGAALSENDLAAELGVSRTPVRESLILLADEGLVDIYPQMGTFVSRIRDRDVASAQFIREALECAALREAAGRATARDIADLRTLLAAQEETERRTDTEGFFQLDEEFHARLMAVSGHGSAWPVVSQAKAQLDRARRLSLPLTQQLGLLIGQHRAVVDLLEEGDLDRADEALRSHLRLVFSDVEKIRARHPELFSDDDVPVRPRPETARRPGSRGES